MRAYRADLHVHTCLSPCGELEMLPRAIVARALELGLDILGICDHNAAANTPATVGAAAGTSLTVIAGLEITSREEVHVLALFDTPEVALEMEQYVQSHLEGENEPEVFGEQVVVDEDDEPVALCPHLLIGATDLSIEAIVRAIHDRAGCAIAAHVDRERFSILGQLGFIPSGLDLDGLEHSTRIEADDARRRFGDGGRWSLVCGSDAHRLNELGAGSTRLELDAPTVGAIRQALRREHGRVMC